MEIDYDSAIKQMQLTLNEESVTKMNPMELQAFTYICLYYLQNEEFSLRDFSLHTVKTILTATK